MSAMNRNVTGLQWAGLLLSAVVLLLAGRSLHALQLARPDAGPLEPEAGSFLVASRALRDPHFARTVVYLLQHDRQGSLGLVINRPLDITLGEALPDTKLPNLGTLPLNYGGPVSEQHIIMLLRSIDSPDRAISILDDIYVSNNMKLLRQLDTANKPATELRLFLGHAGWSAGQLQRELRRDDWFVLPGDSVPVFGADVWKLWETLIERLDPSGIYVWHVPATPARASL
jgi:putative transcriptional regulator